MILRVTLPRNAHFGRRIRRNSMRAR
jgi:hypothetical protein